MLLAYAVLPDSPYGMPELCIIPDGNDPNTRIVRVDTLYPNDAAVYYIGPKEALNVDPQTQENVKILRAVPPSTILLTPSAGGQPGMLVFKVKIVTLGERHHETYYTRDNSDNWRRWSANMLGTGTIGG